MLPAGKPRPHHNAVPFSGFDNPASLFRPRPKTNCRCPPGRGRGGPPDPRRTTGAVSHFVGLWPLAQSSKFPTTKMETMLELTRVLRQYDIISRETSAVRDDL